MGEPTTANTLCSPIRRTLRLSEIGRSESESWLLPTASESCLCAHSVLIVGESSRRLLGDFLFVD